MTKPHTNIWIFLKHSLKFFIVVLEVIFGFYLYDYAFKKELDNWGALLLVVYFVISVEVIIRIEEVLLPLIENKIKKIKTQNA
jgi:hypothetical protein